MARQVGAGDVPTILELGLDPLGLTPRGAPGSVEPLFLTQAAAVVVKS
jgi:hypothetical protein